MRIILIICVISLYIFIWGIDNNDDDKRGERRRGPGKRTTVNKTISERSFLTGFYKAARNGSRYMDLLNLYNNIIISETVLRFNLIRIKSLQLKAVQENNEGFWSIGATV